MMRMIVVYLQKMIIDGFCGPCVRLVVVVHV